jgi:hypothetical protein
MAATNSTIRRGSSAKKATSSASELRWRRGVWSSVVGFLSSAQGYGFAQIRNANFAFDWHLSWQRMLKGNSRVLTL